LHPFAGRCGRPGQRLRSPPDPAGNFCLPVGQIIGEFKRDRDEFDAAQIPNGGGKAGRPASSLARKNRLERLPLPFVGSLIDKESQTRLGACPNIPFEGGERQEIESIKLNVAEMALSDVPS
jgi:hypothetical protein